MLGTLFVVAVVVCLLWLGCIAPHRRRYPYEGLPAVNDFLRHSLTNGKSPFDAYDTPPPPTAPPVVTEATPPKTKPAGSRGEAETKRIMEELFGIPFASGVRPPFMRNPATGHLLELDIYNAAEGIACEYQGPQHFREEDAFPGNNTSKHAQQIYRDLLKPELCQRANVYLITVPYWVTDKRAHIQNQIYPALRARFNIPVV